PLRGERAGTRGARASRGGGGPARPAVLRGGGAARPRPQGRERRAGDLRREPARAAGAGDRSRLAAAGGGRPSDAGSARPAGMTQIDDANGTAVRRVLEATPVLVGIGRARDVIPDMADDLLLHAGPPILWDRMSGPVRGAVVGALLYERRAGTEPEAVALVESGRI